MYKKNPTDELDAIELTLEVAAHSRTFWDADAAELVGTDPDDPWAHPSVDVAAALADGWDDPAEAIEIRELLADEVRLTPLAATPLHRPRVRPVDTFLTDGWDDPAREPVVATRVLEIVPGAGLWPTGDYGEAAA